MSVLNHMDSKSLKEDLYANKKVAIVGPAGYMQGMGIGDEIDSYDVVVRINNDYIIPNIRKKDYGSKVDVIYNSMYTGDASVSNPSVLNPSLIPKNCTVICSMPYLRGFRKDIDRFSNVYGKPIMCTNSDDYERFRFLSGGYRPTSGAMAILDILRHKPKNLFICGFTFLTGTNQYHKDYRGSIEGKWNYSVGSLKTVHNGDKELSYMSDFLSYYTNVSTDSELRNLIKKEIRPTDRYSIKEGYSARKLIKYFKTVGQPGIDTWQIPVYDIAKSVTGDEDYVIDIGCGTGEKLVSRFKNTVGLDLPETVSKLSTKYKDREWGISDFYSTRYSDRHFGTVICSDMIEHILDPDELLNFIGSLNFDRLVISTPDRDTLQKGKSGPPNNPHHVREWSLNEFRSYIGSRFEISDYIQYIEHGKYLNTVLVCKKFK